MEQPAIETSNLTCAFGDVVAVDGISIQVKEGELFGLLGPNGAGKTTLINMLSTMIPSTSGTAAVWGNDIKKKPSAVRKNIGVVFQGTTLDDKLTGRENLDLHGRLYGLAKTLRKERIAEVLKLVELEDKADMLVKKYSGGMMRRLEIARGLMHHPRVLFLDEPTLGLDPQTRNHIWEYIRRLNKEEKVTMVLTTHYMEEADHLCERIAIIDNGHIVALDTPQNLKDALGGDMIIFGVKDEKAAGMLCGMYDSQAQECTIARQKENNVIITIKDGAHKIPQLLRIASDNGIEVLSVDLHRPTLDDVFLNYTGKAIRDDEASNVDRVNYKLQGHRK